MKTRSLKVLVLAVAASLAMHGLTGTRMDAAEPEMTNVFLHGTDGYNTYCIPSLLCTPKGTLLAFCEGRKLNGLDESPTDLVLKRSLDGGKTWLPMQVVVAAVPEAAMDPSVVFDHTTDQVVMVYDRWPELVKDRWPAGAEYQRRPGLGRDSVTTWMTTSGDEGATWSMPVDITAMTKKPEWTRTIHGPGVGIQLRSGRLVFPCCENKPDGRPGAEGGVWWNFAIYSDDHGKTWHISDNEVGPGFDESQMVELADGSLLLNMRGRDCRTTATSKDGGKTWSEPSAVPELPGGGCQGSILRYTWPDQQGGKSRILVCNIDPAASLSGNQYGGRHTGTVRISYDEGKTWPVAKVLEKGSFAYCCLTAMPDGTLGCLFDDAGWSKTTFARFSLEWLTDGADSLKR